METLRDRLTRVRKLTGWSQTKLAARLGLGQQQISFYENGRQPLGERALAIKDKLDKIEAKFAEVAP